MPRPPGRSGASGAPDPSAGAGAARLGDHGAPARARRLALVPAARRLPVPAWALAVAALWLGLVALEARLERDVADAPSTCTFRRITGIPCPTCGSTRAGLAALAGHPLEAIRHNPLVSVAAIALGVWLVLRLGFGRRVALRLTTAERRVAWALVIALVLANWAYVIWRG